MTNREHYSEALEEILIRQLALYKGEPRPCMDMACAECDCMHEDCDSDEHRERVQEWLLSEYKGVDWAKVCTNVPVLVSNDGVKWLRRYYAGLDAEGEPTFYRTGATSWSNGDHLPIRAKYMKLATEEGEK